MLRIRRILHVRGTRKFSAVCDNCADFLADDVRDHVRDYVRICFTFKKSYVRDFSAKFMSRGSTKFMSTKFMSALYTCVHTRCETVEHTET